MAKYNNSKNINKDFRSRKNNGKFKNFQNKTLQSKPVSTQTKIFMGFKHAQTQNSKSQIEALKTINKRFLKDIGELKSTINNYKQFVENNPKIQEQFDEYNRSKEKAESIDDFFDN